MSLKIAAPPSPPPSHTHFPTEDRAPAVPYTIQPYNACRVAALLPLLQETLGNSGAVRKTADFWHWKHEANPFGTSYGLIAWDDSAAQAVGLRVLMRWRFRKPDGTHCHAVRAVDTATHPAYQRMGIFTRLTRQAIAELSEAGVACIFNTPNTQSLPGYCKMGWQVAARWPLYIKPLRPLRMAWRRLRPRPVAPEENFAVQFDAPILPWATFVARYGEEIAERLAQWEAERPTVGLRTARTLDYFQWRYGGHPHIRYGVYPAVNQQQRLVGFAILRPNMRFGWQETVLSELCLPGQERTNGDALLSKLLPTLRSDYVIAHAGLGTVELTQLRRHGFWSAPRQQMIFTVRPLQSTAASLTIASAWDLTLGDLEIF